MSLGLKTVAAGAGLLRECVDKVAAWGAANLILAEVVAERASCTGAVPRVALAFCARCLECVGVIEFRSGGGGVGLLTALVLIVPGPL